MGFQFILLEQAKCVFNATPDGDTAKDRQDLLLCVQAALKAQRLDILIDVTLKPTALEAVLPEVRSLQRVMQNHAKSLTIKGVGPEIHPETLKVLTDLKIEFKDPPSVGAGDLFTDPGKNFSEVRRQLALKLAQARELLSEKNFYQERLKVLKPHGLQSLDSVRLEHLTSLENESALLNREKRDLLIKSETSLKDLEALRLRLQDEGVALKNEQKKRTEPLIKKIADLRKKKKAPTSV